MVLKTLFILLCLVVACSEEKKVEVIPDAPETVQVEETVGGIALRDYERILTPEVKGADRFVFSLSWRMPKESTDSVVVWHTDGDRIVPELIMHSREPDYLFRTKFHELKSGVTHEFHVRVLTDEAMELIFEANYEAYQKAMGMGELLRKIRVPLE